MESKSPDGAALTATPTLTVPSSSFEEENGAVNNVDDILDDPDLDQALIAEGRRLLDPAELNATVKTFRELDTSDSGALDPDQVFAAMQAVKPTATRGQVNQLIAEFDENGDGEIQLDEFVVMMGRLFAAAHADTSDQSLAASTPRGSALKSSKQMKSSGNLLASLSKMANNVESSVPKEDPPDYVLVYLNIGGVDLKPIPTGSLDGCSVHVVGYNDEHVVVKTAEKPRGRRASSYKPVTVGLMGEGPPARPPHPGSPTLPSGDSKKPLFTTKDAAIVENSTIIWNTTVRAEIPSMFPGTLRLDLFVTPGAAKKDSTEPEMFFTAALKVATASLDLGEISSPSWDEEMRVITLHRIKLPDFLQQQHFQQLKRQASEIAAANDESPPSAQIDVAPEKNVIIEEDDAETELEETSVREIKPTGATPPAEARSVDKGDSSRRLNGSFKGELGGRMQRGTIMLSKRINVRGSSKRTMSTAGTNIHEKIPKECQLMIGVVKDPKAVAVIEAMWDTRRLGLFRSVRLMERPWYIVSPSDKRVQRWEIVILFAMIFVSTVTPFEVSVMGTTTDYSFLWFLNWFIDIIFCFDLGLQFFLGYFDRELNQIINDPHFIVARYLKSWFLLDAVSIFPFTMLFEDSPELSKLRVVRIVRLVKLVKLTRLARLGDNLALPSQYLLLIKFSILLLFLLHMVACLWCLLAQSEEEANHQSWADSDSLQVTGAASRYLHGLEFAIMAMVLTYARAQPTTIFEQAFAIMCLIFLGCIYAYAIGSICGIISGMDPAGTEYRNQKDLLKTWASEMHFPAELKDSLLEYLDECRLLIRQRYYLSLLDLLSPTLRGKVSQHTHGIWLQSVPFFSCDDGKERRNFTMAIAECLNVKIYGKGEIVVASGEPADRMFIIAKGVIAQSSGLVLCHGRYFGEDMLLRNGTYPFTFNSVTFVTVNVLSKDDLFKELSSGRFPCTWRSIRRWIVRRAFVRVVKALVLVRRTIPGHKQMSKEESRIERERLIKIGRTGFSNAWSSEAIANAEAAVSPTEMSLALMRVSEQQSSSGTKAYVKQVLHSVDDDSAYTVTEFGANAAGANAEPARVAKLEQDIEVRWVFGCAIDVHQND